MTNNLHDLTGGNRTAEQLQEQLRTLQYAEEPPHYGGGGGGDMEERLAVLETHMAHVREDVSALRIGSSDVRERLSALEVRVEHLPSKGFIVSALLLALAVITGLIAFQTQIQALIGAS